MFPCHSLYAIPFRLAGTPRLYVSTLLYACSVALLIIAEKGVALEHFFLYNVECGICNLEPVMLSASEASDAAMLRSGCRRCFARAQHDRFGG